jgi:hypothetical protein
MALLVFNKSAAPIVLSGLTVTVPASAAPPARGSDMNVTSELRGLSGAQYTALEAQRALGNLEYEWSGLSARFATGTLAVLDPSQLSVATSAALTALDNTLLPNKIEVFVESRKAEFRLTRTSTATVDAIDVLATSDGVGRWHRTQYADPLWRQQSAWSIDVSGDDDSINGVSPPLKTHAELVRRWGAGYPLIPGVISAVLLTPPIRLVTVNILSSLPPTDPIDLKLTLPPDMLLAYVGVPTTVRSGTLTTVTQKFAGPNPNQAYEIADAVTPFTVADVGRRVFLTDATNQFAWVAKDLGAGLMRMSSFSSVGLPPPADTLMQTTVTSPTTIALAPTYAVQSLPQITIANLDFRSPMTGAGPLNLSKIAFANLEFVNTLGVLQVIPAPQGPITASFKGCKFTGQEWTGPAQFRFTYLNCCFGPNVVGGLGVQLSGHAFRGGLSLGTVGTRGTAVCIFDDDFMVQGGGGFSIQSVGLQLGAICAFDAITPNSGVNIGNFIPSTSQNQNTFMGAHRIWGLGNAGFGLRILGNSTLNYQTTLPTITGALGDFQLGSSATAYGVDGSGVVQAPFATGGAAGVGWGNVAAAQPAGGGGNAHNHAQNAHICVRG